MIRDERIFEGEELTKINVEVTKSQADRLRRIKKQTGITVKALVAQGILLRIESIERNRIESEQV